MASVRTLFTEQEITDRVAALAGEIAAVLPADFTIVGVLKGSFVFLADLVRALARCDRSPRVEFIRLGSYGLGASSSGRVALQGDAPANLAGRAVLLVDDIVDTGHTLTFAIPLLTGLGAARVWTCALLDKPSRRQVAVTPDFVGFSAPDVFVVGYGIDFAEHYRALPYLGVVE